MKGEISLAAIGILALVVVAGLAFYGGYQVPLESTEVAFTDKNVCKYGEPEYLTIKCKPSGNPIDDIVSLPAGVDISHTVRLAAATITSIDTTITVKDSSTNTLMCGPSYAGAPRTCPGVALTIGRTYVFRYSCSLFCSDKIVRITGQAINLKLSIGQIGIDEIDMPSTTNCVSNDMTRDTGVVGEADNIISGASSTDGTSLGRSVSLQLDQAKAYPRGIYRQIPPLFTININGQAGMCDRIDKKVYGFTKVTALDTSCWLALDKGNVLVDKSNARYFACLPADCQTIHGLSSAYTMVNYECIQSDTSTAQCITLSDCEGIGGQCIQNADGTIIKKTATSCTANVCQYSNSQVACCPGINYPNNQCCTKDTFGIYKLEQCRTGLLSCESLGSDACCTESQSQYTVNEAPAGKYCCDKNSDGIGKVTETKATCDREPGGDGSGNCGFLDLGCMLSGVGGFLLLVFGLIIIVLILIFLILVAKAVR